MLQLARGLAARGCELLLACPPPPAGAGRSLAEEAAAAGLPPALQLSRARGARPLRDRGEVRCLRQLLAERRVELVHTWHTRDHLLALRALMRPGARRRPALVRSLPVAQALARTPWNRWLFGPGTDGLLCVSPETARRNSRLRGGRPILGSFGAVDLLRFRPQPPDPGVRARLGLCPEHRVVGIVARIQPRRRFDLLLEAGRRLFRADPAARLLVVGRGTRRRELAEEPARRLGIADRVCFAGYRVEDYADVLRAMDLFTFLVPGSDGTCRALLEAMACGLPAVTTQRGALGEIVAGDRTGLLVEEEPGALAAAWQALLSDARRRASFGAAARARAEHCFAPEQLAEQVLGLYAQVLE